MALGITGPVPALHRPAARPAQVAALLRLRELRVRRHHRRRLRRLRPLPDPGQGDARVAEDRRAVRGPAGSPGPVMIDGQEAGLARRPEARARRARQLARAHRQDHGPLDGGADPPLQARHRGHPGAGRARCTSRSSRRAASSACTWSPTAAPGPTGCTTATRRSPTCRPWPRCARAAWSPTRSPRSRRIDPVMGGVDRMSACATSEASMSGRSSSSASGPTSPARRSAGRSAIPADVHGAAGGRRRGDHRPLPAGAVGAAAAAAPGAVRGRLPHPGRDRVLRRRNSG